MKRTVLSLVFSFCVVFCVVFSCAVEIKAQAMDKPLENQYQELDYILNVLRNNRASGEFELSLEQTRLIYSLKSRLEDQYRQHKDNMRDDRDIETSLPVRTEVYNERFAEDLKRSQQQLRSDILLPHQVELLGKFQRKILFDWHLHDNFRRIKGTRFEALNFSDEQLKRFAEIKQKFRQEYAQEYERFQAAVEEMGVDQLSQIHDEMTDEQRELLNIK